MAARRWRVSVGALAAIASIVTVAATAAVASGCAVDEHLLAGDAGVPADGGEGGDASVAPDAAIGVDAGSCAAGTVAEPGLVPTSSGAVRGMLAGAAWSFRGIPYAAPPVGALRWTPTVDAACASGELDATSFGARCPQYDADGALVGDEDCLSINVWTPDGYDSALGTRPVLFFVHGGGNVQGASSNEASGVAIYDGAALAEASGAVVVTFNYRLGPFGFMAHVRLTAESEHASSGNYGILDQIAALRWVQRNVRAFGGDPAHVLLFGESAGAVDTCMLVASPLAAGLFSAALMESGACAAQPLARRELEGTELATTAGCEGAADTLGCLRALPTASVMSARPATADVASLGASLYGPNVDGWVEPESPLARIAAGRHNHVPFVIGNNGAETAQSVGRVDTPAAFDALVHATFDPYGAADAVLAAYPLTDYATPRQAWVQLTSDVKFVCNARQTARAAAMGQDEPVWRYYFTHALDSGPLRVLGAWHGLELLWVFRHLAIAGYVPSAGEIALEDAMTGYWTRLAATGDPNGAGAVAWPEYDPVRDTHLVLDDPQVAGEGVRTAQCDFWDAALAGL